MWVRMVFNRSLEIKVFVAVRYTSVLLKKKCKNKKSFVVISFIVLFSANYEQQEAFSIG